MPRSMTAAMLPAARLLGLLALAACASPQAELAKQAPDRLVGLSKAELLSCAGVPHKSVQVDGNEEWVSYVRDQTIVHRDVDWEQPSWAAFLGRPDVREPEITEWARNYRCEATFTLRNGVVTSLSYNRDRDISQCADILANCLPAAR